MRIAISGSTGFIGKYLTQYFEKCDYEVLPLTREVLSSTECLVNLLESSDVVINLAGTSIGKRWSKKYKKELISSRIHTTRKIVSAINQLSQKPKLFISASAVGYYSSDSVYGESDGVKGDSFLSDLCEKWEHEANQISPKVRLVITRFGVVLDKSGGAFRKLTLSTKLGIVTIAGSGKQAFSWISLLDLARALYFIINNENLQGVVNFTTDELLTSQDFANKLNKHYHCWLQIKIPAIFFQLALGEASQFVLDGQAVFPRKLLNDGFVFHQPSIDDFLSDS